MNLSTAQSSLRALIGTTTPTQFHSSYWGKGYLISEGQPDRFQSLFSWSALSEILSTNRFEFPRLRLLRGGRVVPPEQYIERKVDRRGNAYLTHRASAVQALLEEGAMLHITSIGETWQPIALFAADLERELGARVQVNLHAGYSGSRGFHTHWDGHDVYAAQVDGQKKWRLFGFTERSPLAVPPDEKHGAPDLAIWEGVLNVGQMLYLPRGYWHATQYVDAPSLHLTFAVQHAMGLDFLRWVLDRLELEPALRDNIPFIADLDSNSEADPYISAVRDVTFRMLSSDTLRRYLAEYRSTLGGLNHLNLIPKGKDQSCAKTG